MPLDTRNTPVQPQLFDNLNPRLIVALMTGCNLYGLDAQIWTRFRYQNVKRATHEQQMHAAIAPIPDEVVACVLFDVCCQILRGLNFRYDYTAAQCLFVEGNYTGPRQAQNCMACAFDMAALLYAFGFDPRNLWYQESNPENLAGRKVVMRGRADINPENVRGRNSASPAAAYTPDMSPATEELSNGFKPRFRPGGGATMEMCDRDPFLNHFCCYVDGLGFQFPFFDPLTGARYRNGQVDLFAQYHLSLSGGIKVGVGDEAGLYINDENPRNVLYRIPRSVKCSQVPEYVAARAKYAAQDLWLIVDPADWALQPPAALAVGGHRPAVAPTPGPVGNRPRAEVRAAPLRYADRREIEGMGRVAVNLPNGFQHAPVVRALFGV